MSNRIIVLEDEQVSGEIFKKILSTEGYQVSLFEDGIEAIDSYTKDPCPVFITDLEMPVISGDKIIDQIRAIDEDQVIIVITSHKDSATIIDIMKKDVYDYIVKPVEPANLLSTVKRAFETAELRRMKKILEQEKVIKLQSQLEWFKWNENIITRDYDRIDRSMFLNLHESFNQGAGFGSLLTLVSIISSSAKESEGNYIIDKQLFDLIKQNADIAERILGIFSELLSVMQKNFNFEKVTASELHLFLRTIIDEVQEYSSIRNIKIFMSENKPLFDNISISIDPDIFRKAFYELLINALKFSRKGTSITVMMYVDMKKLIISVLNNPEKIKEDITGIPFEYENLVFEPFFRIAKSVFEQFETADYGLGLTLVDKIINKHNGKITLSNIIDFSDIKLTPETRVNAMISLPII